MTRVTFAWELGANLGHLERDLPVAQRLRQLGADVGFVVANLQAAEKLLAPEGFPFLPCPAVRRRSRPPKTPINFSELLVEVGYDDADALQSLVRAWLELWMLLKPDVIVTDHAPTALLSACIAGIPTLPLGMGFYVPPGGNPMPSFRDDQRQSTAALQAADQRVLPMINRVAATFGRTPFESVGSLFENPAAQITSFPELDPFGPRPGAHYVGPITSKGRFEQISWIGDRNVRVFAYLQQETVGLEAILAALHQSDVETICVIPGARESLVSRHRTAGFRLMTEPVDLEALLAKADAVVSYSSAGLVSTALQAGAPLLLVPMFLEQQLTAARAARLGAAVICQGTPTREKVKSALNALLSNATHKQAARAFAEKYRNYRHEPAIASVAEAILRCGLVRSPIVKAV